jgi:23S rRNA pseudouridine2605 synthase
MAQQRVQKILARAGVASRRKAEELIRAGRVEIDGQPAIVGATADPARQRITVDGRPIPWPPKLEYLALHKPRGYLCSHADPHHHLLIYQLVPPHLRPGLITVGRLDRDSEGLVLLTTDGELAHRLMHPRWGVLRVYELGLQGSEEQVFLLAEGVRLEDGLAQAERVRILSARGPQLWVEVVLRQGRKRQLRRMCAAVGLKLIQLRRVAYGPVRLGDLPPGRWRSLKPQEIAALKATVGLTQAHA